MNPLRNKCTARIATPLRALQAACLSLAIAVLAMLHAPVHAAANPQKPTILLVHGAFAESLSWEAVIERLLADGYPVVAAANPLRGLVSDSAYVSNLGDEVPTTWLTMAEIGRASCRERVL